MNQNRFNFTPPHSEPDTSRAAAKSMRTRAPVLRAQVYAFICSRSSGATNEEIQDGLGLSGDTVRPRVWELRGNGGCVAMIRDSGTRRFTHSGRQAKVWEERPSRSES